MATTHTGRSLPFPDKNEQLHLEHGNPSSNFQMGPHAIEIDIRREVAALPGSHSAAASVPDLEETTMTAAKPVVETGDTDGSAACAAAAGVGDGEIGACETCKLIQMSTTRGQMDDTNTKVKFGRCTSSSCRDCVGTAPADGHEVPAPATAVNPATTPSTQRKAAGKKRLTRFFSQAEFASNRDRRIPGAGVMSRANTMNAIDGRTANNIHHMHHDDNNRRSIIWPRLEARTSTRITSTSLAVFRTKPKREFSRLLTHRSIRDGKIATNTDNEIGSPSTTAGKAMPAGRYFDALKGPELETLKDCEEPLLPLDQPWPFLLRFSIGSFGICLGLGSQAMLWKTMATAASLSFLKIPLSVNLALWCVAVAAQIIISVVYAMKCFFYFEAVRREYYHPVRVNFFFAPWIASMFLTLGVPPRIEGAVHPAVWCVLTAPILMLELKIYGQWLSGGGRRLSKVANPTTHLSLVGNFVSSMLASVVGWKEAAVFFWAVGAAHYLVVFVTLYQRLPTCDVLPKELHPVYFLFVAAPSAASVAWKSINNGHFDHVSRLPYFLALFLYSSLVVRLDFFYGFKFSLTWWAYTFPMTASAIATIHYSLEVRHPMTQTLAVMLSLISSLVVLSLFVTTVLHAVSGRLFPNDSAIAIATKRRKRRQLRDLFKVDLEAASSDSWKREGEGLLGPSLEITSNKLAGN